MFSLLKLGAEKRHTGSLALLGQIYMKGFRGSAKNENLALQYLKLASNQGDVKSMLNLANLSLHLKGISHDIFLHGFVLFWELDLTSLLIFCYRCFIF
jgi:TPR repeat protein